ncbi:hypothetical protein HYZ78_03590 [Candidatus Microgenomates bacterium]|nr:hypothetical protein [Candidatus Microgenomates bacterium]
MPFPLIFAIFSLVAIAGINLNADKLFEPAVEVSPAPIAVTSPNPLTFTQKPVFKTQNARQQVKGNSTTASQNATPDPDPVITCKSKTGNIQVRRSTCSSYTDCPDGSSGYIFESQDSCKKRWNKINQEFKNLTDEFVGAMRESNRLSKELFDLNLKESQANFDARINEIESITNNLPELNYESPSSNIILPTETPKPSPNYEGTIVY